VVVGQVELVGGERPTRLVVGSHLEAGIDRLAHCGTAEVALARRHARSVPLLDHGPDLLMPRRLAERALVDTVLREVLDEGSASWVSMDQM
jgi:hypothetical protein